MAGRLQLAFDILARDAASKPLRDVGNEAERTGHKVEASSGRMRRSFGLLASTFASSSAGALGPLKELTDKFEIFERATEDGGGSKVGNRILGIGLAATAAGSFLESLHSREQAAQQQLQTAIESTGHSYEEYAGSIEKAIKGGERFGQQASSTLDALNRLTVTTHDPAEAIKDLGRAEDVAAVKHISLAKAAEVVGLIYNGSTRAGKQFGLTLENVAGAAKQLESAQKGSVSATTAAKDAQRSYSEKLDEWNQSSHKTLAQAYALRDAHDRLVAAQAKAKAAAEQLKEAQQKAADAAGAGARNTAQLDKLHGQAEAAARSFTGVLKAEGAQIEDALGKNGKLGGALVTAGALGSGLGALISSGVIGKIGGGLKSLATQFGLLRDAEVTSSAQGTAAIVADAGTAEAAMTAEGDVAVATASRMRVAFASAAAGVGLLVVALSNVKFDDSKFKTLLDDPKIDKLLGYAPPQTGDTNADDDKLAIQRQAHAKQVADAVAAQKEVAKAAHDAFLAERLRQINDQKVRDALRAAAEKDAQTVVDAIGGKFQAAQSRLQALVSAALSLRQSVTSALQGGSALTDVFQGPDLNANGAFGHQNNFGRIRDFLQKRVALDRKFILDLRALIKQGLDPSLVAQIASAGPDAGLRIAEGILSGGRSGVGQVNSLERTIASLANTTGKTVADQRYAQTIAEQRRNTEVLGSELKAANARLAAIQKNTTKTASTDASLVGVL